MRARVCALVWVFVLSSVTAFARTDALQRASQLELAGHFQEARAVLTAALTSPNLSAVDQKEIQFEIDRLERIKKDFRYTKESLCEELKKSVRGLTLKEFEQWIAERRFDSREIDGRRLYMSASVSNLFFRYPELSARRIPPKDTSSVDAHYLETCMEIKRAARLEGKPYVLPKHFEVTMTAKVIGAVAPEGETIRAWLPIPRTYPFQGGFALTSPSAEIKHTDSADSPIRSIYLQQSSRGKQNTEFKIEYRYTAHGVWFNVDPAAVKPLPPDSQLNQFIAEAPHVQFTPELRALSQQIAGNESNPYLKAKRFYDWIADNIKYSFACEYSTIRNLSEYCRTKRYGDCGQEAMLFITLCRLSGIPARWQSGWNTFPGAKDIHDWTELYLAPYGWIPVDPYMGIYAMRYAMNLKPEQRRELRDFYFGGLDQYRLIANSDHNQTLAPPKHSMRSDNVDFQRGELEWGNHNIYFDQFKYDLVAKEVESAAKPIE